MFRPRIVVIDPSGDSRMAVSTLLRYRRWNAVELAARDIDQLPDDTVVVFAVENGAGDGMRALRRACKNGLRAARILLCSPKVAARVVARGEPAHQVVARPANADKVLESVKRALRVRDLVGDPDVNAVASTLASVPALPDTWVALNELLQSDTASMQDAASLVERDPGLAAKVLQLVNSGMFAMERPVATLFAAVQRLGISMVRDLVLSAELFEDVDDPRFEDAFGPGPLSTTSYLVARASRMVAPRAAVHTAFTSGLFAQLGRMAFATQARDRFLEAVRMHGEAGTPLEVCEARVFGVDSRTLSAWMLATWGLPHEVVEAVRWSADPTRATGRGAPLALSVFLGARLIEEAWLQVVDARDVQLVSRAELAPWGLSDALADWREEAQRMVERVQQPSPSASVAS